jgi:hypothetical protein
VKGAVELMKNTLRVRFWTEAVLALIAGILFIVTLVKRDWIELIFGVDPDNHSGSLEMLIVGGLLVVTIAFIVLASVEWRRARVAIS